jgi:opacity protein-like surface antigen
LLGFAGLLMAAIPALAQSPTYYRGSRYDNPDQFGEFRLWVGGFRPDAHGDYWNDNFRNFTANRNDFQDVIGGGDFILHFDRYNSLMFSASYYTTTVTESYRFFADNLNGPIRHDTSIDIASGSIAYVLFPAGTHTPVMPYLGGGVGIYGWRLHEDGDFVDTNHNNVIFGSTFADSGTAFGYFFVAGLEVPVTRHVALLVDARYTKSHDNLGHDLSGFGRLDLSGGQVAGGVAWHL